MKRTVAVSLGIGGVVVLAGLLYLNPWSKVGEIGPAVTVERSSAQKDDSRDWAVPLPISRIRNFHRVTKDLYRGGQPTAEGVRELEKLGVKTIINLRSFHSDRDEIGDLDIHYEHIAMKAWHAEDEDVVRFLEIVSNQDRTPVFVHCQYGSELPKRLPPAPRWPL